jgi:hypothetical protein
MNSSYVTVADFFDGAEEMRRAFDEHFLEPHTHGDRHQVWNYWHVPGIYTYLRTSPERILPQGLVDRFRDALNGWAMHTLGLASQQIPWFSLYVNGCGQGIHNDSRNGQMGFVYSLTDWERRKFIGGETLLFRTENYWETDRVRQEGAGESFYESIPARFNQLLVFDDRVIHGVQPLSGTMEPLEGRVVMHGHLSPQADYVTGGLTDEQVETPLSRARDEVSAVSKKNARRMHGFLTLRLEVKADGKVSAVKTLVDRILSTTPDKSRVEPFKEKVKQLLKTARFPKAARRSEITTAVLLE